MKKYDIDRWKILKIQPFEKAKLIDRLLINNEELKYFIQNNPYSKSVLEYSREQSYLIVDPYGNFIGNKGGKYTTIGNLKNERFEDLLEKYNLNNELYLARYGQN